MPNSVCINCPAHGQTIYRGATRPESMTQLIALRRAVSLGSQAVIEADEHGAAYVYTLKSGRACRFAQLSDGRRQILGFYGRGACLTIEFLAGLTCPVGVRSLTPVQLCAFPRTSLFHFLDSDAEIRHGVFRYMVDERRQEDRRKFERGALRRDEALASLILWFAERSDTMAQDGSFEAILFPLRLADIAETLGITGIHAGRIMRKLEKHGAVRRARGGMLWIDRNMLLSLLPPSLPQ